MENKLFLYKVFRRMKKFSIIYLKEVYSVARKAMGYGKKVKGCWFGKEQSYISHEKEDGQ